VISALADRTDGWAHGTTATGSGADCADPASVQAVELPTLAGSGDGTARADLTQGYPRPAEAGPAPAPVVVAVPVAPRSGTTPGADAPRAPPHPGS
jgi:hypothetical protein